MPHGGEKSVAKRIANGHWYQFRLRSLLLLTLVFAALFACLRPWLGSQQRVNIYVKLSANGTLTYEGDEITLDEFKVILNHQRDVLGPKACKKAAVIIIADPNSLTSDTGRVFGVVSRAGFDITGLRLVANDD